MGWKEFYTQQTRKFVFDELGCPDFWVRMKVMAAYPYGKSIEDGALIDELAEQLEGEKVSLSLVAKQADISDQMMVSLLVEWNLTDPETDEPLPLPTKEDTQSLRVLPNAFIALLNEWAAEAKGVPEVPPKSAT